ncbi:hypothetical protein CICLE_v10010144mg [Citrus x clementina]|uniref:Peptidase S8/S53 domain-containing protein n=1 Tax=Citrus clementina TaxID=85681 RepID=V4TZE8_CITCL|nr:hypothetical protein CICLE_v10010144mg [Citrus x clementina]
MVHGILTVVCAGIEGPDRGTVDNLAPWLLTVGVDRESSLVMLHLETISNSSEQALRLKARYLKIFMNWSAEKMPDSPMQLLKMRPGNHRGDTRRIPYNTDQGTSMASPHVAGAAGLIKTLHPDWGPAAIRSAIMTTATPRDTRNSPILEFNGTKATPLEYGSGPLSPNSAMDPGPVYELSLYDYSGYLSNRHCRESMVERFVNPESTPSSTYNVQVTDIPGISTAVESNSLTFTKYGEERTFKVTFTCKENVKPKDYVFGELT